MRLLIVGKVGPFTVLMKGESSVKPSLTFNKYFDTDIVLILVSHLQNIRGMQVNVLEFEFHCCRSRHLGIFSQLAHPVA